MPSEPAPRILNTASGAGRCWRCRQPLSFRVTPNGYGQLIEECRHCLDEIEGLQMVVRHLRALTGWTPPRPFDGPLVLIPVYVPRPAAVVEGPKVIRRCGCGRPLRRRRNGSTSDTCFFCQQGRVEPRRV